MILTDQGGRTNGEHVEHCEADEEGTRKGRKAVVSIEFSTRRFCWDVLRSQTQTNTQETNDVSGRTQENSSRAACKMEKDSNEENRLAMSRKVK